MKVEQVINLSTKERFLYWITERDSIHHKRMGGQEKPWTDDKILQTVFFTNPYRENDKTSTWFRKNIRDPLKDSSEVFMATVIFRWFNKIDPTGKLLLYPGINSKKCLLTNWNADRAAELITEKSSHGPVFTGAFMIKAGNGPAGCKIPNVCGAISSVWRERKRMAEFCKVSNKLESVCKELTRFAYLGGFMSYEIVCDLRHTALLKNATDINTWANMGPGARRGINRLTDESLRHNLSSTQWLHYIAILLKDVRKLNLKPLMEMREVEHSLCEFDKYERILWQQGRAKRKYNGGS